ncbi:MAG: hypothetical protein QOD26_56 [Betaproteobacteria bacterium]|nr:hypothetical protein [Betaproteobacteria bacterium]
MIKSHVFSLLGLTTNPQFKNVKLPKRYQRVQELWKALLHDICSVHGEYLDVGTKLAGAAKNLKADRDAVAHWPASRSGFSLDPEPVFIGVDWRSFDKEKKQFSPEEVYALSERIFQLGSDVTFFGFALFCDLFPSRCTWRGPKPEGPILRTRPILTIQKPIRRQRPDRL